MILSVTKNWVMKIAITGLLLFLLILGFKPVMEKYSQSFKFVDEAEHMVMGWLMGKGYSLYTDFPNNHQPISYFASSLVHQTDDVNNVFMLVRRHRQAIFVWSVLWWLLLLGRFGIRLFIPLVIFENIKYYLLGNLFLAESIVVYPLFFLAASLLVKKKQTTTSFDHYSYGLLTAFSQLTLLPMAPALLALNGLWLWQFRGKGLRWYVFGILTMLIAVFWWINPVDYLMEVRNGLLYSLPGLSPINQPVDYLKLIGLPILFLPFYQQIMGQVVILMLWWWLVALTVSLYQKRLKTVLYTAAFLVVWLVTNMREVEANLFFYRGFHIVPWFLMGLGLGFIAYSKVLSTLSKRWFLGINFITAVLLVMILSYKDLPWYTSIDPDTDHYIQYTPLHEVAQLINTYKEPGDRLIVMPNASWLYYMTDLLPADTNMFTYYDWQVQVPNNRTKLITTMEENPPTFIVYDDDGSSYNPMMNEYLKAQFIQVSEQPELTLYVHQNHAYRLE
jgi:hypothetical protein